MTRRLVSWSGGALGVIGWIASSTIVTGCYLSHDHGAPSDASFMPDSVPTSDAGVRCGPGSAFFVVISEGDARAAVTAVVVQSSRTGERPRTGSVPLPPDADLRTGFHLPLWCFDHGEWLVTFSLVDESGEVVGEPRSIRFTVPVGPDTVHDTVVVIGDG